MIVLVEQDEGLMVEYQTFEGPDDVIFVDYSEAIENSEYSQTMKARLQQSALPLEIIQQRVEWLDNYIAALQ